MSRTGITFNDVAAAANAIQDQGDTPTIDKVRAELGGTGSNSTISKYLNQWRDGITVMSAATTPPPDVVQVAVERVWTEMREKTTADIEAVKAEANAVVVAADERVRVTEAAMESLRETHEALQQSYYRLSGEKEILSLDMKALKEEHRSLSERYQALEQRHDEQHIQHGRHIEDLDRLHQKELLRLEDKSKQTSEWCEQLLVEVRDRADTERLQSIAIIDELNSKHDTHTVLVNDLQTQLQTQSQISTQLETKLNAMTSERDKAYSNLGEIQGALLATSKIQQASLDRFTQQIEFLSLQNQELTTTLTAKEHPLENLVIDKFTALEALLTTTLASHHEKLSLVK